jgi:hypothetical protein
MASAIARPGAATASAVTMLRWPRDAVRRDELAAQGAPCLQLVEDGVAPPHVREQEDWLRVPADERDLLVRLERLALLTRPSEAAAPKLDGGVLRAHGMPAATEILSPAETALVGRLVEDFERLVTRPDLALAVWGGAPPGLRALDSLVARCRKRLAPLGFTIGAVRGSGFVLAAMECDGG